MDFSFHLGITACVLWYETRSAIAWEAWQRRSRLLNSLHEYSRPPVACKSCQSADQSQLNAEVAIHFSELKGPDMPIVIVVPKTKLCLQG